MAEPPDYKVEGKSSDPEKVLDLEPKSTLEDGELRIMFKHADPNDGDEALKAFAGHEGEMIVMTPEMEKKLLRKIDWNLMPVGFRMTRKNTYIDNCLDALRCLWPQLSR